MAKKSGKATSKRKPAKAAAKPAAKQTTVVRPAPTNGRPRRLKPASYKTLRLQKRLKHPVKLPSIWRLTRQSLSILWQHKWLFLGLTLLYGVLNLVLVQGFAAGSTDVGTLKHSLSQIFTGNVGAFTSSLSILTLLIGSAGNSSSPTAGAYQLFLALFASLAVIWTLRQVMGGKPVRVRDAYYRGMYPLVPFVLVLMVAALQLIPLLIGSTIYNLVVSGGIAVYFAEKLVWGLLYALLALLSLYMLSSSLFALYIVTLPRMTPMKALRSARGLVRHRRWTVLRKVIGLPVVLLIGAAVIMVPIISWLTPLAQWVFFLLTMFALAVVHAYMYTLYRELLNE